MLTKESTLSPAQTSEVDVDVSRSGTLEHLLPDFGGINLKLFRTKHFPDSAASWRTSAWSCGVLIDERILFTSDTRFDPALLAEFDGKYNPEIIFHDCQLFTGGVHTGIEELATLPTTLKEKLILVHYGDQWQTFKGFARKAGFHSWA
ncbi:hypothetical protein N9104_03700, partial [Pseudomonadales bacterium]|nr:hypothetical protein [Pseudomonadales bacterium]